MTIQMTVKKNNRMKLNTSFLSNIPLSVKIGIIGEFLGRIGMGLVGTYFIFYVIALSGSLVYYPVFLTGFLICSILGSSISGILGSKFEGTSLLKIISLTGPLFILCAVLASNSIYGLFISYSLFSFIFSFFNPLFSSHVISETKHEFQDLSYSFYRGASIVGQNLSGSIGGFVLIEIFFNDPNVIALRFLLVIGFILIGSQIMLLFFIHSTKKIQDCNIVTIKKNVNSSDHIMDNMNNLRPYAYSKFTPYLILICISLSSFGVGSTYSYIALFITKIYTVSLGDISIILSIIGLITGFTTFTTAYFTKKFKRNQMLGISDLFFGLTSILMLVYPPFLLICVMLFFREITSSITSPIANIIVLTSISDRKLNLVSSISILIALVSELLGSVIAVILIDNTGAFYNFLLSGICFLFSSIISFSFIRENKRSLLNNPILK